MNISGLTKPIAMLPTSLGRSDSIPNPNPFEWNISAVKLGLVETQRLRGDLLSHLKALLDDFHGVERSIEYYDLVAGDWLILFSHNVYSAWREVLAGGEIIESGPITPVLSIDHASRLSIDHSWHQHLRWSIAQLLQGHSSEKWDTRQDVLHIVNGSKAGVLRSVRRGISDRHPEILFTFPYYKVSHVEWMSVLLLWRRWVADDSMQYPITLNVQPDWRWRKQYSTSIMLVHDDFSGVLQALMPLYIPVTLLEGFASYRNAVLSLSLPRPEAVYSANAMHGNLTWKIIAAEWRQEGTKLLYHQHGGGFGLEPMLAVEEYEIRNSDRYYSWGWTHNSAKIKALSPAMPFRKRVANSKQVVLCCIDSPGVLYYLHTQCTVTAVEKVHQESCSFLLHLDQGMQLVIRPYPVDYGWNAVERMRNAAPYASFDNSSNSIELFYRSSLVVHNYLGTSWLETLGLNIPTLCFYNAEDYYFRSEVFAFIDALKRVGILHDSGRDAARFITALGNDIDGWWNKPEVQEARQNFVQQYANFSPDWKQQWQLEFEEVLDRSAQQKK